MQEASHASISSTLVFGMQYHMSVKRTLLFCCVR